MKGKMHSAQDLTIKLLRQLYSLERLSVYMQAETRLRGNARARAQLSLCGMMAGELDRCPEKYKDLKNIGKAILARQRDTDPAKIRNKDIGAALGFAENNISNYLNRTQEGSRELTQQEICNLCADFAHESDRLFWENQIYLLFPNLRTEDVQDGPVLDCLQAVWDSLPPHHRRSARLSFELAADWFRQLDAAPVEAPSEQEEPGLFNLVEEALTRAGVDKTTLYAELNIDPDTWYSYKKIWTEFEENSCKGDFPRLRLLDRRKLLYLAVFLRMDFYSAVTMLAKGGYCFHFDQIDAAVAGCLLNGKPNRDAVLEQLLSKEK